MPASLAASVVVKVRLLAVEQHYTTLHKVMLLDALWMRGVFAKALNLLCQRFTKWIERENLPGALPNAVRDQPRNKYPARPFYLAK
jgi:hypothetical protein